MEKKFKFQENPLQVWNQIIKKKKFHLGICL